MRMFAARRQRRIPRCLLRRSQFGFQSRNPPLIVIDHRLQQRLEFRRQGGHLFGRDRRRQLRHTDHVANFANGAKTDLMLTLPWGVNGYDCLSSLDRSTVPRTWKPDCLIYRDLRKCWLDARGRIGKMLTAPSLDHLSPQPEWETLIGCGMPTWWLRFHERPDAHISR